MKKRKKVVLIGWDAADWKLIGPLLAEGKMPALKGLMDRGVYGNMSTMNPPFSPMLWTSVATSKTADKHGILGFVEIDTEAQMIRPVRASGRKTRAIWNILHNQGYQTNLVGWWPSYPAEPINGCVVSDVFVKQQISEDPEKNKGMTHPEELLDSIRDYMVMPKDFTPAHILPFIPGAAKIDNEKDNSLRALTKILSQNTNLHSASTYLMENTDWDFTAIYYDMIDHMCHRFVRYHPPKLAGISDEAYEMYKNVINGAYQFQDMMLERTIKLAGDDALIIVMSDHGFVADQSRMLKPPKEIKAAPAMDHRELGMFVMSGPGVKKGEKIHGASLLDVTPTILHYLGLPIGRDMSGAPMTDIFEQQNKIEFIESWDLVSGDFGESTKAAKEDQLSDQQVMEQLIELGYIDKPEENIEKAIKETWCDLQYNLSRVYMGKGEVDQAEEILLQLEKEPLSSVSVLIDLLKLKIDKKDFKSARNYLDKVRAQYPNAKRKTNLAEAKILIGEGQIIVAENLLSEIVSDQVVGGAVNFELGKLFVSTSSFEKARECLEKAVAFKPDNAKYNRLLAHCYLLMDQYELAADYALISVELVRYYPAAHYTLGQALEKMGMMKEAKLAFETALKIRPKHKRAKLAKENIEIKESDSSEKINIPNEDIITIVSGLPRSGTSMMMQMLEAGGTEIFSDGERKVDINNPKGYYEHEAVKSLFKDNSWLQNAKGKAVKVVSSLLPALDDSLRYRIVFMIRDLEEVMASQQKMLNKTNQMPAMGLKDGFVKQMNASRTWCNYTPGVEVLYVDFKDAFQKPKEVAERIKDFLNHDMDTEAMINVVDQSLYRNKK